MLSFGLSWALSYFCATVWPSKAATFSRQNPSWRKLIVMSYAIHRTLLPASLVDRVYSRVEFLSIGVSSKACHAAYASFKALKSPSSVDDTQWLTYWVVYSVLTTVEAIATSFTIWFPFYYEVRLLFVLWLVLPQTKGAQLFFETYIEPLMAKYGSSIDPAFQQAEKVMESQHVQQIVSLSQKYGPQIAQQALARAAEEAQRLSNSQGAAHNQDSRQNVGAQTNQGAYPRATQAPPGFNQPHRY